MATPSVTRDSRTVGIRSPALKLLAWFVCFITLVSTAGAIILIYLNLSFYVSRGDFGSGHPLALDLLLVPAIGLGTVLTTLIGLLILYRSANWQMGWLLVAFGGVQALGALGEVYTEYNFYVRPEANLPLVWPLAWFQHWAVIIIWSSFLVVLPMLFPNGRLLSKRWRFVFRLFLIFVVLFIALLAFGEGPLGNVLENAGIQNPYGFIPFGLNAQGEGWELVAFSVFIIIFFTFALLALISLVLRYRRSRGYERQQFKWVAYVLALWALGLWIEIIGRGLSLPLLGDIGWTIWHLGILGFPLAIGFAILKYRLYDIDRLINRTLVYGVLTAALALVYFGSVVLMQQVFPADSPVAIVLSTLAVAALFSPLRRRIQEAIDKRFYRRKYNAEQILAAFSARMRDEVELEQISEKILSVVNETMQPTTASLWLREAATSPPDRG